MVLAGIVSELQMAPRYGVRREARPFGRHAALEPVPAFTAMPARVALARVSPRNSKAESTLALCLCTP